MQTKVLKPNANNIKLCADHIKNGGIVGFGTETVYGLGANAFDGVAISKIYSAKGRPSDNPLIVHIAKKEQISMLAHQTPLSKKIVAEFMPAPLTIILNKKDTVLPIVSGGLDTVAIRMPKSKLASDFISACGVPLVAPSGNLSGSPSPTSASHILNDLDGKIDYILDGGECEIGLESTVIDVRGEQIIVLRMGSITKDELQKIAPVVVKDSLEDNKAPISPGLKYKHYSPKAKVYAVTKTENMQSEIILLYDKLVKSGANPIIIGLCKYSNANCKTVSSMREYAKSLYALLRDADTSGYDTIIAELVTDEGIGGAINNRLTKASGGNII